MGTSTALTIAVWWLCRQVQVNRAINAIQVRLGGHGIGPVKSPRREVDVETLRDVHYFPGAGSLFAGERHGDDGASPTAVYRLTRGR